MKNLPRNLQRGEPIRALWHNQLKQAVAGITTDRFFALGLSTQSLMCVNVDTITIPAWGIVELLGVYDNTTMNCQARRPRASGIANIGFTRSEALPGDLVRVYYGGNIICYCDGAVGQDKLCTVQKDSFNMTVFTLGEYIIRAGLNLDDWGAPGLVLLTPFTAPL